MNVAAYLRVSSDKQDVTRQRESIERWSKQATTPIAIWLEDSVGRNSRDQAHKRPGFQKLLGLVEADLVDCIVVDSQDRFGTRDAHQWGAFLTLLRDHGCTLLDASGKELSSDDDAAVLTGTLGAMTSAREQKEKAHRNLTGKLPKARLGEYQGGNPPYGFDVVCLGTDGKEKWRSVYLGHYKRLKVNPDKTEEVFDGKDNSPRKNATDTLCVRPSIRRDRIKTAQQIFKWFVTETISARQIATRLNQSKADPVFSDWNKVKIAQMLANPVYIGLPTWNKRAGSRFVEFVEGQVKTVTKTNGRAKLGRRRETSDYIQPDAPQFKPMIDQETWDRTQAKIKGSRISKARRPAKTAELWLKPFLICGQCGKAMHATRGGSTARLWPSYFCGTYGIYGPQNPTGCHCHRVRHAVLEKIVGQYLAEMAPKVAKLLAATKAGDLEAAKPLLQAVTDLTGQYNGVVLDMMAFVDDRATGRLLKDKTILEAYGVLYERLRPSIEKEIAAKQKQIDGMLDEWLTLPERLRKSAVAKMEPLQAEVDSLKEQLTDLRKPWGDIKGELAAHRDNLKTVTATLTNGAAGRQKTEALSSVVDRIVCHFRHTKTKDQKNNGKSYLASVEIVPIAGEKLCFTSGIEPGRG